MTGQGEQCHMIITQSTLGLLALLCPTVHKSLPTCKTKPSYINFKLHTI